MSIRDLKFELERSQDLLLERIKERNRGEQSPLQYVALPASGCMDYVIDSAKLQDVLEKRQERVAAILRKAEGSVKNLKHPSSLDEILARLVLESEESGRKKVRVRVPEKVRFELKEAFTEISVKGLRGAPGGSTFFASLVAAAAGHKVSLMMPDSTLPVVLKNLLHKTDFSENITFITEAGLKSLDEVQGINKGSGEHFSFHSHAGSVKVPDLLRQWAGETFKGIDMLVTGTTYTKGFGAIAGEYVKRLTGGKDAAFVSGFQGISSAEERNQYICEMHVIAGGGLLTTAAYSQPVNPDTEPDTLFQLALSGTVDQLSLNAPEASELLKRICELESWREAFLLYHGDKGYEKLRFAIAARDEIQETFDHGTSEGRYWEAPHSVYLYARTLTDIFSNRDNCGILSVRVRGAGLEAVAMYHGLSEADDLADVTELLAQYRELLQGARVLSFSKTQNLNGWFPTSEALKGFEITLRPDSEEMMKYCEMAAGGEGQAGSYRSAFRDPVTHQICFFIYSPDLHHAPGGVVSLGDTNDSLSLESIVPLKKILLTSRDKAVTQRCRLKNF